MKRMIRFMQETELVTNYMASTVPHHLHPDSLLVYSRRAIEENPFLTGMAILMEPNYFPEKGRYYSAYSLRDMTPGSDISSRMKKSADDISHLAQKLEEVITDTSEPVIS